VKFEIQQEDLQNALDVVAAVVPAKTTIPVLTCILIETSDGKLTLSATNLDVSVTTVTDKATIGSDGKTAAPAQKLVSFVRSLAPGLVTFTEKDGKIQLRSGKASLEEMSMNPDEYPALPEPAENERIEIEASTLIDMVAETAYAVSRDETRPALMGILWEVAGDALTLVATDAHRLALSKRPVSWEAPERNLIVDTGGLRQLPRIVTHQEADEDGAKTIAIFLGDNQISFRAGETILHARILEGPFPDYGAVIPSNNDKNLIVDRELLAQAVRRVSITADRITSQIRFGLEKDRLELSAESTEGSRAEDELTVDYSGEALEIGFNFSYLQDVLKNIRTDQINISLRDTTNAAVIEPVTEDGVTTGLVCLLMPLRLTSA